MNRSAFYAMTAQYRTPRADGTGRVCWDDGIRCRLPGLTLRGALLQEGTDSRNLFWQQGGEPYSGLTVDYDPESQTFTLNGTVSGSPLIRLCSSMEIPWETGRTYTLARFHEGGSAVFSAGSVLWSVFTADNARFFSRISESADTVTEALRAVSGSAIAPSSGGFVFYLQCLGANVTFTDYKVRFLLTPTENYDGSWYPCTLPRPGAPQPLLPNNAEVKLRGRNLYARSSGANWTDKGVEISYDPAEQVFTLNGTLSAAGDLVLDPKAILPWRVGKQHTVSILPIGGEATLGAGSGITYSYSFFSQDRALLLRAVSLSDTSMTSPHRFSGTAFNEAGGEGYIFYLQCWRKGTVFRDFRFRVQVEEGSTATLWQPGFYGGSTATPELYAIPGSDYADEWDAVSGKGIRRCAVIDHYAGEEISTPYVSSEGSLVSGAMVVYGIPDTAFSTGRTPLTMPDGYGEAVQTAGDLPDVPMTLRYLTHSR